MSAAHGLSHPREPRVGALAALSLTAFCGALNIVVLGPFLPAMALDLGVGVPLLGQAPALANLIAAGAGLLIGPLADRYGQRRTLALGLLALAVSSLGVALAPGYVILIAAVLIGAPGRSIAMPLVQAIAGTAFSERGRQRAVAWTQVGVGASVTLGMPLLTSVDSLFGWRVALLTFAGVALAVAGLARLALPPIEAHAETPLRLGGILAAYVPLLRNRPTLGLIASTMIGNTAISSLLTYVGAYLVEVHGLTASEVGWAFSLSGAGLIVGGILGSRLAQRFPARSLAISLMLLRGAIMAAMLLVPADMWPSGGIIATALFGLIGLGDGVYMVSVVLALTGESPAGRGTTMVANGSAVVFGNAIGSAIGGLLLALGGYALMALHPPLATIIAAFLIWRSGRR